MSSTQMILRRQSKPARAPRSARGYTLIELMIVIAIVAIITAIAYPAYSDSARKSRRGNAKAMVAEIAQRFERYHTVNNTYIGAFDAVVPATDRVSPNTAGATPAYNIAAPVVAANTFTILMTPVGGQVDDARCMAMSLNQAGVKTESGYGTVSDCW